jgi:hypothetical protein
MRIMQHFWRSLLRSEIVTRAAEVAKKRSTIRNKRRTSRLPVAEDFKP